MGVIFLAERDDDEYRQRVAIKVLKRGMDTEDVLRRFRRERQTLARLVHPNIARLLDGGATEDGRPYFVMEYIDGRPIDWYCDDHALPIDERLRLFLQICRAVRFAHSNLVVHRDLKPGNILVTAEGVPKLLDFGIVKLLADDESDGMLAETSDRTRLMTPRYASPEQVRGEPVTTATDVYSLGLVLYELLTGHRPYHLESGVRSEVERVICEEEPVRPSTIIDRVEEVCTNDGRSTTLTPETVSLTRGGRPDRLRRRLSGDLDNIVLMALRKDPERRYPSVEHLSDDIRRYLELRPVTARPDSFVYRSRKFVARNRAGVAAAVLLATTLVAGGVATALESRRAHRAERRATNQLATANELSRFLLDVFEKGDPRESRDTRMTAEQILERGAERVREEIRNPLVQATLMNAIGNAFRNTGSFEKSEPLLREALRLREEALGKRRLETAESCNSLGMLLFERGEYEEARNYLDRALAVRRELLDPPDADIATSENNLGMVEKALGRKDSAEAHFRRALAMRLELFGAENRRVAYTLNNLGRVLYEEARYDEAEMHHRRALAVRRAVLEPGHPDIAESLHNLAVVLLAARKLDEAESLNREALELHRRRYGDEHPRVARSMANLGSVLLERDRTGEARRLFEGSVRILRGTLDARHPDLAMALNRVAQLLLRSGEFDAARERLEEALAIQAEAYQEDHRHRALTLTNLGWAWHGLNELARAEGSYREALGMYERLYGPDHGHAATARFSLASVIAHAGRHDEEALDLLRKVVEDCEERFDADHQRVADASYWLGSALGAASRPEAAQLHLRRALEIYRRDFGDTDVRVQGIAGEIARILEARGEDAGEYRRLERGARAGS